MLVRFIQNASLIKTTADGKEVDFFRPVNKMLTVKEVCATNDEQYYDLILKDDEKILGVNKDIISIYGPITPYVEPSKPRRKTKSTKTTEDTTEE